MRSRWTPDSTPRQSALLDGRLANRFPMFSILGLLEGVVLKAYYKDDAENLSGQWTEYDLVQVGTRTRYGHARVMTLFGGINNGSEVTLAETTGTTDGSPLVVEDMNEVRALALTSTITVPPTEAYKLNGERVFFTAVGGAHTQAMIVGSVQHPDAGYGATRAQAPRKFEQFNGWTSEITKDGTLRLTHSDGRHLRFNPDGSIDLAQKAGALLRLGSDGASASAVRGETNNTNLQSILDELTRATTGIYDIVNSLVGVSTLPPPAKTAATAALTATKIVLELVKTGLPNALSTTVKVP